MIEEGVLRITVLEVSGLGDNVLPSSKIVTPRSSNIQTGIRFPAELPGKKLDQIRNRLRGKTKPVFQSSLHFNLGITSNINNINTSNVLSLTETKKAQKYRTSEMDAIPNTQLIGEDFIFTINNIQTDIIEIKCISKIVGESNTSSSSSTSSLDGNSYVELGRETEHGNSIRYGRLMGCLSVPCSRLNSDGKGAVEQWYQLRHPSDQSKTITASIKLSLLLLKGVDHNNIHGLKFMNNDQITDGLDNIPRPLNTHSQSDDINNKPLSALFKTRVINERVRSQSDNIDSEAPSSIHSKLLVKTPSSQFKDIVNNVMLSRRLESQDSYGNSRTAGGSNHLVPPSPMSNHPRMIKNPSSRFEDVVNNAMLTRQLSRRISRKFEETSPRKEQDAYGNSITPCANHQDVPPSPMIGSRLNRQLSRRASRNLEDSSPRMEQDAYGNSMTPCGNNHSPPFGPSSPTKLTRQLSRRLSRKFEESPNALLTKKIESESHDAYGTSITPGSLNHSPSNNHPLNSRGNTLSSKASSGYGSVSTTAPEDSSPVCTVEVSSRWNTISGTYDVSSEQPPLPPTTKSKSPPLVTSKSTGKNVYGVPSPAHPPPFVKSKSTNKNEYGVPSPAYPPPLAKHPSWDNFPIKGYQCETIVSGDGPENLNSSSSTDEMESDTAKKLADTNPHPFSPSSTSSATPPLTPLSKAQYGSFDDHHSRYRCEIIPSINGDDEDDMDDSTINSDISASSPPAHSAHLLTDNDLKGFELPKNMRSDSSISMLSDASSFRDDDISPVDEDGTQGSIFKKVSPTSSDERRKGAQMKHVTFSDEIGEQGAQMKHVTFSNELGDQGARIKHVTFSDEIGELGAQIKQVTFSSEDEINSKSKHVNFGGDIDGGEFEDVDHAKVTFIDNDDVENEETETSTTGEGLHSKENIEYFGSQLLPAGVVDFVAVVKGQIIDYSNEVDSDVSLDMDQDEMLDDNDVECRVAEQWPTDDPDFPQMLEWFCFPRGWRPKRGTVVTRPLSAEETGSGDGSQENVVVGYRPPDAHTFTFSIQLGGVKAWGVCLIDYETPPSTWSPSSARPSPTYETSKKEKGKWYWPVSFCLLTQLPVVSSLSDWLMKFSKNMRSQVNMNAAMQFSTASLAQLCVTLPCPVHNKMGVKFTPLSCKLENEKEDCKSEDSQDENESDEIYMGQWMGLAYPLDLPALCINAAEVFDVLSAVGTRTFLEIIACLLSEQKIILHSANIDLLTPIAEIAVALIWPLKWPHAYIPVLPLQLISVIQAPTPVLVGIHTDLLKVLSYPLEDCVLVDIDSGVVDYTYCEGGKPQLPPSLSYLSLHLRSFLKMDNLPTEDLQPLFSSPNNSTNTDDEDSSEVQGADTNKIPPLESALFELRLTFASALASLLNGFERCIFWVDTRWPVFDSARFLSEYCNHEDVGSMGSIISTMIFLELLEHVDESTLTLFNHLNSLNKDIHLKSMNLKANSKKTKFFARVHSVSSAVAQSEHGFNAKKDHGITGADWLEVPCLTLPKPDLVLSIRDGETHLGMENPFPSCQLVDISDLDTAALLLDMKIVGEDEKEDEDDDNEFDGQVSDTSYDTDDSDITKEGNEEDDENEEDDMDFDDCKFKGLLGDAIGANGEIMSLKERKLKLLKKPSRSIIMKPQYDDQETTAPSPMSSISSLWTVKSAAKSLGVSSVYFMSQPVIEEDNEEEEYVRSSSPSPLSSFFDKRGSSTFDSLPSFSPNDESKKSDDEIIHPKPNQESNIALNSEVTSPVSSSPGLIRPLSSPELLTNTTRLKRHGGERRTSLVNSDEGNLSLQQMSSGPLTPSGNMDKMRSNSVTPEIEMSREEERLLSCVATALSKTPDQSHRNSNSMLLTMCQEDIIKDVTVANRLMNTLRRLSNKDYGAKGGSRGNKVTHSLPSSGFESLALLCEAFLDGCLVREDFESPFHILQLTATFQQLILVISNEQAEGEISQVVEEVELLSARLAEHRLFIDPRLWESMLASKLKTEAGIYATTYSEAAVVRQLTSLLFSMRAIGTITPHRSVLFVRRTVEFYKLSQSHVLQLHGVLAGVWREMNVPLGELSPIGYENVNAEKDKITNSPNPSPKPSKGWSGVKKWLSTKSLKELNTEEEEVKNEEKITSVQPLTVASSIPTLIDYPLLMWQGSDVCSATHSVTCLASHSFNETNKAKSSKDPMEQLKEARLSFRSNGGSTNIFSSCIVIVVTGSTDKNVRLLQGGQQIGAKGRNPNSKFKTNSDKLKKSDSSGSLLVTKHHAQITAVEIAWPYIISADAIGCLQICTLTKLDTQQTIHRKKTETNKTYAQFSVVDQVEIRGHTKCITSLVVPRSSLTSTSNDVSEDGGSGSRDSISLPFIASTSKDGTFCIWSLLSKTCIFLHNMSPLIVYASLGGQEQYLHHTSNNGNSTYTMENVVGGKRRKGGEVTCVAMDEDINYISTGYGNGNIMLWKKDKTEQYVMIYSANCHSRPVRCISLFVSSVIRTRDGTSLEENSEDFCVWLISGSNDCTSSVINITNSTVTKTVLQGHTAPVSCTHAISIHHLPSHLKSKIRQVKFARFAREKQNQHLAGDEQLKSNCIFDEFVFVTGSADGSVRVWDVQSPLKPLIMFEGHGDAVFSLNGIKKLSKDLNSSQTEHNIISCSNDGSVCVWDLESTSLHKRYLSGANCSVEIGEASDELQKRRNSTGSNNSNGLSSDSYKDNGFNAFSPTTKGFFASSNANTVMYWPM